MSTHDHSHDHDHEDDEDGIGLNIDPREDRLVALGISHEEFDEALMESLDSSQRTLDLTGDPIAPLEGIELTIRGIKHRLGDLAVISIDEDDLDDIDEDEEDEEIEEDDVV